MDITDEQKAAVTAWVRQGASLSDIQSRLKDELNITLTYVDTRFLLADLDLELTDHAEEEEAPPPEIEDVAEEPATDEHASEDTGDATDTLPADEHQPAAVSGEVSVTVDSLTRASAVISGKVTFSDGESAAWHIDQMGQLRLDPAREDYRPSEEDIAKFQVELQKTARKQGL